MDDNNRRAFEGGESAAADGGGEWRSQLPAESRQRIINEIMDALKRLIPFSGEEALTELKKISARFEEKIYTAATSQNDYLKKIYLKMLTLKANNQQTQQQSQMMSQMQSQPVQFQQQLGLQHQPNPQTQQQSQMMSRMQSQPVQLQQQLGLQHQPKPLDRDVQQNLQTLQQKQFFQPQRAMEALSTSLDTTAQNGNVDGGDWKEEIYQKIVSMKDMYFQDLNDMYQTIVARLHQHESSLLQQPQLQQEKNPQVEKLKAFKSMLERFISLLQISKSNIQIGYKDKLGSFEKHIMSIINSNKPRKHIPPMQQTQPPQSQMTQIQPHENQMNFQMRSQNLQGSGGTMQQNVANLQHNPSSPLSGVSNAQKSMINSLQPSSALGPGQSNSMNSVQQVATGPLQQNPVSFSQQANVKFVSSQSGLNSLQANLNYMHPSSSMLPQHLKQQKQFLQNQQLKQFQHSHMQQNSMQKQLMQQRQQFKQTKLHPAQMQSNHSPMVDHMSDSTAPKTRQQLSVNSSVFQQHPSEIQRSYHQQLKPGNQLPISSPQLLQPASSQISHYGSSQVDQQNMLTALNKAGTPLQPAISPSIVPSPSTPTLQSPMLGESEKVNSSVSSLSKAGNIGHTAGTLVPPLLDEFTSPEAHHSIPATTVSGKSNATEEPFERLIKVVKSMSSKALTASVCELGSVVSMIDNIAGFAPGNGSRAAVSEDLVEMTKCRLRGRNFITQDETTRTKKIKLCTTATPSVDVSYTGSINDSFKQLNGSDLSYLDSTATSTAKKPRIEVNHALLEELREINFHLVDTVVNISDEDADLTTTAAAKEGGEGTVVKCSFSAVALSPNLKLHYVSSQMSQIHPIRLLVPKNYPNCSPVLLDKFPVEVCKEYEDLSVKARSRFSISLQSLSQPMSIRDIAKTWDVCARDVISEYAQQRGGGSFSSKYGTWENCLTAA